MNQMPCKECLCKPICMRKTYFDRRSDCYILDRYAVMNSLMKDLNIIESENKKDENSM